jgi:ribonuclease D
VAAATLGSQAPGLASVLKEHFEIELDKSMQRSNWSLRPLSEKQIRYARLDTHFLLPLMREQRKALAEQDRAPIVDGECLRLERLSPPDAAFDPEEFVRIKGARALGPLERQVLRELFILREQLAEASDQPPFRIMNNDALLAMARARPRHRNELAQVPGFSPKQVRRMGDQVLDAIARAVELGPMRKLPQLENRDGTGDLTDEQVELHERLKQWRKGAAIAVGIDSAYLLNRRVLLLLSKQQPTDLESLRRTDGIQPWQVERHGDEILAVVAEFQRELKSGTLVLARRRPPHGRGG